MKVVLSEKAHRAGEKKLEPLAERSAEIKTGDEWRRHSFDLNHGALAARGQRLTRGAFCFRQVGTTVDVEALVVRAELELALTDSGRTELSQDCGV